MSQIGAYFTLPYCRRLVRAGKAGVQRVVGREKPCTYNHAAAASKEYRTMALRIPEFIRRKKKKKGAAVINAMTPNALTADMGVGRGGASQPSTIYNCPTLSPSPLSIQWGCPPHDKILPTPRTADLTIRTHHLKRIC